MGAYAAVILAAAVHSATSSNTATFTLQATDDYSLTWVTVADIVTITFSVKTDGWVGFGVAENAGGGMAGADMATIEWVNGTAVVRDRYAVSQNSPPLIDPCGPTEWTIENVVRQNGVTSGTLRRAISVSDPRSDRTILPSQRVLMAYGSTATLQYHGAARLAAIIELVPHPPGTVLPSTAGHDLSVDLRAGGVEVPAATTAYGLRLFDLFEMLPALKDAPHQLIGFQYLGDAEGKPYSVHHVTGALCSRASVAPEAVGKVVFDSPGKSREDMIQCGPDGDDSRGYPMLLWAPGSDSFAMPDEAGFRVGDGLDDVRYLLFEYHYDNPTNAAGSTDNSGLRLLFTKNIRPNDAAVVGFGDNSVSHRAKVLLPNTPDAVQHDCPQECIDRSSVGDFKVFGVLLHMHQIGVRARASIWRGGVFRDELARVDFYNFGYQTMQPPKSPTVLQKGDSLHLTCEYFNTYGSPAMFGLGSRDEMCLGMVIGYPRENLVVRQCGPVLEHQGEMYGVCGVPSGTDEEDYVRLSPNYPSHVKVSDGPIMTPFGNQSCGSPTPSMLLTLPPGSAGSVMPAYAVLVCLVLALVLQ